MPFPPTPFTPSPLHILLHLYPLCASMAVVKQNLSDVGKLNNKNV